MRTTNSSVEIKRQNMIKTLQYILRHEQVSRQEIAVALGFSLPTVFQNVTELMDWGLVCEAGEYGSTGGRKAKVLKIKEGVRCVAGVEVAKNYICMILMDLSQKILNLEKRELVYQNTQEYYMKLGNAVRDFVKKNGIGSRDSEKLIGIGISVPGTIDHDLGVLRKSYSLDVQNVGIRHFAKYLSYDFCCENNANCAANAVSHNSQKNVIYLMLSDIVCGSIRMGDGVYMGDNFRSAEFGHMVLKPEGKMCCCGKKGCLNAYCSTRTLTENGNKTLQMFFEGVRDHIGETVEQWDQYLEYLAIAVSNIRTIFDCDIILGGEVGGYLKNYAQALEEKIRSYNMEDFDLSYLKIDSYDNGSCAVGAALFMLEHYIENLQILKEK